MATTQKKDGNNGNCDQDESTIEDILVTVGEFGRFQKLLVLSLIILCFPINFQVLLMYFSTIKSPWRCHSNSTLCTHNGTLFADDVTRCDIPNTEWYYTEQNTFSIVTQFNINCEEKWKLELVSCMIFIGWTLGGVLLGWIGDQYGRRVVLAPSYCIVVIVGFIRPFLPNIYLIMICQFVIGICVPGVQLQAFILISEFVGSKQRPFASLLLIIFNPVCWCILAFKAYMIQNWKILSIVCTAPYMIFAVCCKFIPESIKWTHLHGKKEEVVALLKRIAKWNKKEIKWDFKMVSKPDNVIAIKTSPLDLFCTRSIALKSIIQAFLWYSTITAYYGLHMAADDLGGSVYRDFALLNLCETPGLFLASYLCSRYGRKPTTLLPLFTGSLGCLIIAFIPTTGWLKSLRLILGIIGDVGLSMAFFGVYQWSVEIYPIEIRNQGMGFLQVVSHGGSAVVPWIVKGLKTFGSWCPFFVLGLFSLVATAMSLWLPETREAMTSEKKVMRYDEDLNSCTIVNEHTRYKTFTA